MRDSGVDVCAICRSPKWPMSILALRLFGYRRGRPDFYVCNECKRETIQKMVMKAGDRSNRLLEWLQELENGAE